MVKYVKQRVNHPQSISLAYKISLCVYRALTIFNYINVKFSHGLNLKFHPTESNLYACITPQKLHTNIALRSDIATGCKKYALLNVL